MADGVVPEITPELLLELISIQYKHGVSSKKAAEIKLKSSRYGRSFERVLENEATVYVNWRNGALAILSSPLMPEYLAADFLDTPHSLLTKGVSADHALKEVLNVYGVALSKLRLVIDEYKKQAYGTNNNASTADDQVISILKIAHDIYLELANERLLIHQFMPDSLLEEMFNYVYSHSETIINIGKMGFETSGYNKTRNLADDLRTSGFSRLLKKHFFPVCTPTEVLFNNPTSVSAKELGKIKTELKTGL
jgi:hypothetical protein